MHIIICVCVCVCACVYVYVIKIVYRGEARRAPLGKTFVRCICKDRLHPLNAIEMLV